MTVLKKTVATLVTLGVLAPALAFAQTSTPSSTQALLEQIRALQAQMASLVQQQQTLAQQQQGLEQQQNTAMVSLIRSLRQGATGDDVRALQALLAADSDVYPDGTVSGYYGRLTAEAVKRFQKKHGIEQAGFVGPKTLKKLNDFLSKHPLGWQMSTSTATSTRSNRPCAKVPPGHLIAPGWLRKHAGEDRPLIPECQKIPGGIWDKLTDGTRPDGDRDDKIAPVISSVSATSITTTGATILFTVNEGSLSNVSYGTTTAYASTTPLTFAVSGARNIVLTGLTASTVYHFQVISRDAQNNTATTSSASFVTTAI